MITFKCDWCGKDNIKPGIVIKLRGVKVDLELSAETIQPLGEVNICRACLIKELQKEE